MTAPPALGRDLSPTCTAGPSRPPLASPAHLSQRARPPLSTCRTQLDCHGACRTLVTALAVMADWEPPESLRQSALCLSPDLAGRPLSGRQAQFGMGVANWKPQQ